MTNSFTNFMIILLGWHKPLCILFTTDLNMGGVLEVESAPSPRRTND